MRIQLETVFLSSGDLVSASLSLFVDCKQYTIFVNLTSHFFPRFFFLFLMVRYPSNHLSVLGKHETGVHSLLLFV